MENPQQICSTVHDLPATSREPCPLREKRLRVLSSTSRRKRKTKVGGKLWRTWIIYMPRKWCTPSVAGARFLYHHCRLIVLVRPFEVRDLVVALKMPDSRCHLVYQIVIVGHQQHRTVKTLQRNIQRVDRFQIQMVRRLVEHQHIRLLQHQLAKQQARGFSAGEH